MLFQSSCKACCYKSTFSFIVQEELPDLDEIERELKMLDEQILQMAQSNNINAEAVLASTETNIPVSPGSLIFS